MKNEEVNEQLSRSVSQQDHDEHACFSATNQRQRNHPNYSSSCSSLTSGIGLSDNSISNNDRTLSNNLTDTEVPIAHNLGTRNPTEILPPQPPQSYPVDLNNVDAKLKTDIRKFVDSIFTDSQSISLEKKSEFGKLARSPEARLLFAIFVDDYRVNSKRVDELTFYSLAQYFSIVLLECLLAEDFRPAKIIMNMMFTYYFEQNYDKIPLNDRPKSFDSDTNAAIDYSEQVDQDDGVEKPKVIKTYLYTLLKDQQIFKSIRFWTSAFYESVIIERNNHPVFVDREHGKLSHERRNEELDCSKNITFGLLSSFIYNMSLLDLSQEFCQEFLDKHSTIAGLSDDQSEMLKTNMKTMFSGTETDKSTLSPVSTSEKVATFLYKLGNRLNNHHNSTSK